MVRFMLRVVCVSICRERCGWTPERIKLVFSYDGYNRRSYFLLNGVGIRQRKEISTSPGSAVFRLGKIFGTMALLFIVNPEVCVMFMLFGVFVLMRDQLDSVRFAAPWSAIHSNCWALVFWSRRMSNCWTNSLCCRPACVPELCVSG